MYTLNNLHIDPHSKPNRSSMVFIHHKDCLKESLLNDCLKESLLKNNDSFFKKKRKRRCPEAARCRFFAAAEQTRTQAGPLTGYSHAQPAKWISFGSFAKACHGKSFYSGFLLFLEKQGKHKYYSLTKKSGVYHTSLDHQRSTKSPSQTQKCM